MSYIQVTNRRLKDLKPHPQNARTHSRRQVEKIAESIKAFGFNEPIGIDDNGVIVFGHGRAAAAELVGMKEVPTVNIDHLSDEQKRAYRMLLTDLLSLPAGMTIYSRWSSVIWPSSTSLLISPRSVLKPLSSTLLSAMPSPPSAVIRPMRFRLWRLGRQYRSLATCG